MDLVVIVLVQLSALGYGLYSMYEARPVWMAYVVDRFELVRANDIVEDNKQTYNLPKSGPKYIYVDLDSLSADEKLDSILEETQYNISPAQRPKFYKNYNLAKRLVIAHAQNLKALNNYNDSMMVSDVLKNYPNATGYLPMKASAVDMSVLINSHKEGEIVDIVDLRPW